jgi:hypothetical protein
MTGVKGLKSQLAGHRAESADFRLHASGCRFVFGNAAQVVRWAQGEYAGARRQGVSEEGTER